MCKYCDVGNSLSGDATSMLSKPYIQVYITRQFGSNYPYVVISEYEKYNGITHKYCNSPYRSTDFQINYCPICGCDLRGRF